MAEAVAALAGSLDDFPAPPLLRLVQKARHSGTLTVILASQPVALCFEEGEVTYAGPVDLDAARAALLATGLVAPEAAGQLGQGAPGLVEARRDLAVNTVFELLLPTRASFWFEPTVDHPLAGGPRLLTEQLILEATARLRAWQLIAEVIPSTSIVLRLADLLPPGTERVSLDRDEWPVLAAIDGRRDVADLIGHTGLSAFGVCGVLHRLITLGVAEPVG
jgi:hypothetical protein